jgi:hypothetical protein
MMTNSLQPGDKVNILPVDAVTLIYGHLGVVNSVDPLNENVWVWVSFAGSDRPPAPYAEYELEKL